MLVQNVDENIAKTALLFRAIYVQKNRHTKTCISKDGSRVHILLT